MPAGADVTVPPPLPASVTVRTKVARLNCAVADALEFAAGIVQAGDVPLQAPLQPPNDDVAFGEAVSVIAVDALSVAEHVLPQLMPAGDETIVPAPEPVAATVTLRVAGTGSDVPPPEQPPSNNEPTTRDVTVERRMRIRTVGRENL
jgi:hypothetical protein